MVLSTTRLPAERKGITKWSCLNPGVDQACGKEISICLSVWICFLALLPTKPFTLQISHSSSQNRKRSEGPQNENWPAGLTHFPLSQQLSLAKHAHQTNIPSARHHSTVFSVICWEHNTTLLPFLTQKFQFSSAELYFFFFICNVFIHSPYRNTFCFAKTNTKEKDDWGTWNQFEEASQPHFPLLFVLGVVLFCFVLHCYLFLSN